MIETKKAKSFLFWGIILFFLIVNSYSTQCTLLAKGSSDNFSYPNKSAGHNMVFDSVNRRVILFGGMTFINGSYSYLANTWSYDCSNTTWIQLLLTTQPSGRAHYGMAFDSTSNKIVLFGGLAGDITFNDTWIFDCITNQWSEVYPEECPTARSDAIMYYDPVHEKIVLFGGYSFDEEKYLGDTWIYDIPTNTWEEKSPESRPDPRYGHRMVYDSDNQKGVLFGGRTSTRTNNDLWTYNYSNNSWKELNPANKPGVRYWHTMAYDSKNQKVIVFGGRNSASISATLLNDTWSYDPQLNEWEQVHPEIAPSSRMSSWIVYDSHNHKVILFGGSSDVSGHYTKNDTWNYEYAENKWTEVVSSVNLPENTGGFEGMVVVIVFLWFMIKKYRKTNRRNKKLYDLQSP